MNTDKHQLGTIISAKMIMSESASRSIAREALIGLDLAGQPTDKDDIFKAAYDGLKRYYSGWSDDMNKRLAQAFTEAYIT